ncbi:MAG TPA: sugar kinase [Clostridiaceae bacterium]|nr:sugar kinase [Clostridiaceae bacterium]
MSPGAGANVAANIAALEPDSIEVLGVVGEDWRADALLKAMQNLGINTNNIIGSSKIVTNAYCKPIRKGISPVVYEDPRIDFANYKNLPEELENELLSRLDEIIDKVDVLCVADQLRFGCITPKIRQRIISLGQKGKMIVVDSRDRIKEYKNVILKPNEVEGYKAVYGEAVQHIKKGHNIKEDNKKENKDADNNTYNEYGVKSGRSDDKSRCSNEGKEIVKKTIPDNYVNAAKILAKGNQAQVCMTLGPNGCLYTDGEQLVHIPCHDVKPPIDFCGAGDTFLSGFSCAIAAGAKPWEAAAFANMAAEVTIKKIGTTGTARPEEIRKRYRDIIEKVASASL